MDRFLSRLHRRHTPAFTIRSPSGVAVFERYDWFVLFGWHFGVNRFVAKDDADHFHTHPSTSFRLILSGGYVEEALNGELIPWRPGRFGLVWWHQAHRVHALIHPDRPSWSFFVFNPTARKFRTFHRA